MKNVEDIYELSPMQQGMLFHSLYDPEGGAYVEQLICTIDADLDTASLRRACQRILERHAILRTAFHWEALDKPLQVVQRHVELPWQEYDWRAWSAAEQEKRLENYLAADSKRGFDLTVAPLAHFTLIHVTEKTSWFIWSFHHILLDGWCWPIVLREVLALYEAFCQGRDLYLENPPPYRDYILWLQRQDLSQAQAFWRETLRGFAAPTPLGVDGRTGGPPGQGREGGERRAKLPAATTAALKSFARQNRLTLNTLLQGAWALLLSRYNETQDIVFGATVSGRPADLPGAESMVGLFINTLPLRVPVPPDQPLLPWLKGIQARQIEMQQYEHTPLVEVQRWSDVPRGTPLFESILVFENYPVNASLGGQLGSNVRAIEKTHYPLTLAATPGAELSLQIEYDRRRFDDAAIARMLGHLQVLLEGMVAPANSRRRPLELPLLAEAERRQILQEWNDTGADRSPAAPQCVHELFEAQVERTPDAVAVVQPATGPSANARQAPGHGQDHHLTYQALNRRANQLAHHLQALGVGPETPVGICMTRSPEMVTGLLGVLKAGGAYVPLDPAYPGQRLAFMLVDTRAPVLLTASQCLPLVSQLPGDPITTIISLDTDWQAIAQESDGNLGGETTPENLAYAIYTSGSTGEPKGVVIQHRSLVNFTEAVAQEWQVSPDDRVLQFASFSWDTSAEEIYPSLARGATIVLRTDAMLDATDLFWYKCNAWAITLLDLPTAYWHELMASLDAESPALPPSLRLVLIGGERALGERLATWQAHVDQRVRLMNTYGATEATAITTMCTLPNGAGTAGQVPIGRAIGNVQTYVLDRFMRPVPIGVPGELYIGGAGLARGYLNSPGLTAQRFVPHPFPPFHPPQRKGHRGGARLYKTGDLACYLPNGHIECLGRIDQQVKIRGVRVEPGEVESVLVKHPSVHEAAVVAWENLGQKRLAAYVVPHGAAPAVHQLRSFLARHLPDYWIPASFTTLDGLPLTSNGKVDRRALPAPDGSRPELAVAFEPPRTPTEKQVAEIWSQVLGLDRVGLHDNFFDLGGHSLLATQVVSRIRRTLQVELSLRALFEAPTVAGLAEHLETIRWAAQDPASSLTLESSYEEGAL